MKNFYKKQNKGGVMILTVLFFLIIGIFVVGGASFLASKDINNLNSILSSGTNFYVAESGIEDALYRLKYAMPISSNSLTIDGRVATTTITTTSTSTTVLSLSSTNDFFKRIQANITIGAGIDFNYGIQSGNGGFTMGGGTKIIGNVYSNGFIDARNGPIITGTAIAADSPVLTVDQENSSPSTPPSSITFGNTSTAEDFAQSFTITNTSPINKIQLYIKKVGSPSDPSVRIVADNNGIPSTTEIDTGGVSLNAASVGTSYSWVEVVFTKNPSFIASTTYWLIIDGGNNSSKYFVIGANSAYSSGAGYTGKYSGTWISANADGYFKVFTGGIPSYIGGGSYVGAIYVGTSGIGDAWSRNVSGASVEGGLYCNTGSNNNKTCNTSKGIPPPVPLPFSEEDFNEWKVDAAAGGTYNGNYVIDWQGGSLGPKKITGNLTLQGGGVMTLTGPIWVQGDLIISNGASIKLPTSYAKNSELIIADGKIVVSGGANAGSGTPGSYLFLVSTSRCPNAFGCNGSPAIYVSGGAGAIAVSAQNGTVSIAGNAKLNSAVGNTVIIDGGSTVTYDQGLANPSFTSGPSGGYNITSWGEL